MAAIGTIGMAIGIIITVTILSSSSAISAFQGGGAGAGDIQDIMAMDIRMSTTGTAMAIRTDTAAMVTEVMDTVTTATVTAMDMATVLAANTVAANTALRLGREWPSYNGDSHAPAIIAGQLIVFRLVDRRNSRGRKGRTAGRLFSQRYGSQFTACAGRLFG